MFFDVMEFRVIVRDIFGGWIGVRLGIVKINSRVGEKGAVAKSCCIENQGMVRKDILSGKRQRAVLEEHMSRMMSRSCFG